MFGLPWMFLLLENSVSSVGVYRPPYKSIYFPNRPYNILLEEAKIHWTYTGKVGPSSWPKYFPFCGGNAQSPINIQFNRVARLRNTKPYVFNGYRVPTRSFTIQNNGHTVQVSLPSSNQYLFGGQLAGSYKPLQFHFHWGKVNYRGSEHTFDSRAFPLEMHIVHMNRKYRDFSTALKYKDGLAVVAVMFKIGAPNRQLQNIISRFSMIQRPDTSTTMRGFALDSLLPWQRTNHIFYKGSLTTPTCNQVVSWIILAQPLTISARQMQWFRSLKTKSDSNTLQPLVDNFRPTQPINGRRITFFT